MVSTTTGLGNQPPSMGGHNTQKRGIKKLTYAGSSQIRFNGSLSAWSTRQAPPLCEESTPDCSDGTHSAMPPTALKKKARALLHGL